MANKSQLARLKKGVDVWNVWRKKNWGVPVDLTGADLTGVNLMGVTFFMAHLSKVDFSRADLTGADFSQALLIGANFFLADLTEANFSLATLSQANFTETSLVRTNLSGAHLTRSDFTRARLLGTILGNTELTDARGLDSCYHIGPSTIDHRTLMRSWPLPLAFLRGCGLPDTLIDYLPSLVNEPLQFYSCFISHSSIDHPFVERHCQRKSN